MRILLLGATGFIGRHLLTALRAAGHDVVGAGRGPAPEGVADWLEVDYRRDQRTEDWLPRLSTVDAVVNAVGIFREAAAGDFDALHWAGPRALFAACEQAGVNRVIHLSALGATTDAPTRYWRSKAAGDAALRSSRLNWVIVRPSLVFGAYGRSSRLFLMLAALPWLALPVTQGKVQPIHIDDLCAVIVRLVANDAPERLELAAVGPRALSLQDYLDVLRKGLGLPKQPRLLLPNWFCRLFARLARYAPGSLLTTDSLTMLASDNCADPAPVTELLGKPPRAPETFVDARLRPAATLCWWRPLARLILAALWLWTAAVSLFGFPHAISQSWLISCGIPPELTLSVLLAASLTDAALGFLTLVRPGHWLWRVQAGLILGYTLVLTLCLPEFWFHPFGPLSKNLPILALLLLLDVTEE